MPLSLPGREAANRKTLLERHCPCLRKRHPVLGAVVGHITDLEPSPASARGRRASRCNTVIDQQSRPNTETIQAVTRNLQLNNATDNPPVTGSRLVPSDGRLPMNR